MGAPKNLPAQPCERCTRVTNFGAYRLVPFLGAVRLICMDCKAQLTGKKGYHWINQTSKASKSKHKKPPCPSTGAGHWLIKDDPDSLEWHCKLCGFGWTEPRIKIPDEFELPLENL